jgi:catechol 2,3-dioxygenase-like lactoylglutathione lyase family enzyme
MADMSEYFQVDQFDHVEMFVPDRYQAAEWYKRVLGIEIIPEFDFWAEETGGPLMISSDGCSTKLALFEGEPPGDKPTAGFHRVAFRVGAIGFLQFIERMSLFDLKDIDGQPVTRYMVVDHDKSFSIYFCDP